MFDVWTMQETDRLAGGKRRIDFGLGANGAGPWISSIRALLFPLLLLFASFPGPASAKEEFLEPDQAFQFSARALDSKTIEARFTIADGYYLYRERFKFSADAAGVAKRQVVQLGEPVYPKGKIKFDQTFQRNVEYYRTDVLIRIPVVARSPGGPEKSSRTGSAQLPPTLTLHAIYQGCADAGLCYAPIEAQALVDFASPGGSASFGKGANGTGGGIDESAWIAARTAATLRDGKVLAIGAIFVGLGLLLSSLRERGAGAFARRFARGQGNPLEDQ